MGRWLTAATVLASATALVLRLVDGEWELAVGVTLALFAVRLMLTARAVVRRELPWTRLVLPALLWVEAAALLGDTAWEVRIATATALELGFYAIAIRALLRVRGDGPTEVRIACALETVVPRPLARLVAIELVLVGLVIAFFAGGWRRPPPAGISYHRENGLRHLLAMLPLLALGDVLLLELVVLPDAELWVRAVVHALAIYGLIWLVALYASARARPHRLVGTRLELHRGVLGHLKIEVGDITSIAPRPAFSDGWKERAYKRASLRFDLGATHVLEVMLRDGRRLLVGVDDAEAFVTLALPTPVTCA